MLIPQRWLHNQWDVFAAKYFYVKNGHKNPNSAYSSNFFLSAHLWVQRFEVSSGLIQMKLHEHSSALFTHRC